MATTLGYSETVFLDDVETMRMRLFTPARELPFAGHALVGVSWLLARHVGRPPDRLYPALLDAPVPTFVEAGITWVRGSVADSPPWEEVQLDSSDEVDALECPQPGSRGQRTQAWAWLDESAGVVRARVFALAYGVAEDEACGSASLKLAARLGRPIIIRHGHGSLVWARPFGPGMGEVGGHVAYQERVEQAIPASSG